MSPIRPNGDRRDDLTRALDDGRITPRIVDGRLVVDAATLAELARLQHSHMDTRQ